MLPSKSASKSLSLNPCCNGIYSMSYKEAVAKAKDKLVLILVVMEYTQ